MQSLHRVQARPLHRRVYARHEADQHRDGKGERQRALLMLVDQPAKLAIMRDIETPSSNPTVPGGR